MYIHYSGGSGGRSAFFNWISENLLGELYETLPKDTLSAGKPSPGGASPQFAGLDGARMWYASEYEGCVVDECITRQASGGDRIKYRVLFDGKYQYWYPMCVIVILANKTVKLADYTHNNTRRVNYIVSSSRYYPRSEYIYYLIADYGETIWLPCDKTKREEMKKELERERKEGVKMEIEDPDDVKEKKETSTPSVIEKEEDRKKKAEEERDKEDAKSIKEILDESFKEEPPKEEGGPKTFKYKFRYLNDIEHLVSKVDEYPALLELLKGAQEAEKNRRLFAAYPRGLRAKDGTLKSHLQFKNEDYSDAILNTPTPSPESVESLANFIHLYEIDNQKLEKDRADPVKKAQMFNYMIDSLARCKARVARGQPRLGHGPLGSYMKKKAAGENEVPVVKWVSSHCNRGVISRLATSFAKLYTAYTDHMEKKKLPCKAKAAFEAELAKEFGPPKSHSGKKHFGIQLKSETR
jgi:hypothetical protein